MLDEARRVKEAVHFDEQAVFLMSPFGEPTRGSAGHKPGWRP